MNMIYKIPYEEDCSWTFAVKERSFSKILKIEIDPKRQFRKNKQRTVKDPCPDTKSLHK